MALPRLRWVQGRGANGPFVRAAPLFALLLVAVALAGCFRAPVATVQDAFPDDPDAGSTFHANATAHEFAVHLDVAKAGRVAYRVLAREGVRVDACLLPGRDADLWWANHTVPVLACQRDAILAKQGADLDAGPWTLAIRAHGCPAEACAVTAVVVGAETQGTSQGPADPARVEALDLARCAVC